jgi:hypothetical protein
MERGEVLGYSYLEGFGESLLLRMRAGSLSHVDISGSARLLWHPLCEEFVLIKYESGNVIGLYRVIVEDVSSWLRGGSILDTYMSLKRALPSFHGLRYELRNGLSYVLEDLLSGCYISEEFGYSEWEIERMGLWMRDSVELTFATSWTHDNNAYTMLMDGCRFFCYCHLEVFWCGVYC